VGTGAGAVAERFARELDRHLGSLLQGGLSPHEFRRWFASDPRAAEGSADEVENIVAERSGDHITDEEMLRALDEAIRARSGDVADRVVAR